MRILAQYKKMKISESSPRKENAKIKSKFKPQSLLMLILKTFQEGDILILVVSANNQ